MLLSAPPLLVLFISPPLTSSPPFLPASVCSVSLLQNSSFTSSPLSVAKQRVVSSSPLLLSQFNWREVLLYLLLHLLLHLHFYCPLCWVALVCGITPDSTCVFGVFSVEGFLLQGIRTSDVLWGTSSRAWPAEVLGPVLSLMSARATGVLPWVLTGRQACRFKPRLHHNITLIMFSFNKHRS